jgi:hypothetical protein
MRRAVSRFGLQRGRDQLRHALVVDRARLARANIVVEAGDAPLDEARSPLAPVALLSFSRWEIDRLASPSATSERCVPGCSEPQARVDAVHGRYLRR